MWLVGKRQKNPRPLAIYHEGEPSPRIFRFCCWPCKFLSFRSRREWKGATLTLENLVKKIKKVPSLLQLTAGAHLGSRSWSFIHDSAPACVTSFPFTPLKCKIPLVLISTHLTLEKMWFVGKRQKNVRPLAVFGRAGGPLGFFSKVFNFLANKIIYFHTHHKYVATNVSPLLHGKNKRGFPLSDIAVPHLGAQRFALTTWIPLGIIDCRIMCLPRRMKEKRVPRYTGLLAFGIPR